MILIIDNYDSFTYNLVHLVAENLASLLNIEGPESASPTRPASIDQHLCVRRNDQITLDQIREMDPAGILISPGPGRPEDSRISMELVEKASETWPILGVCLGHQIIGARYGGTIDYAPSLMHGKTSLIHHDRRSIFKSVEQNFVATRYHSLVVRRDSIPDDLEVSAETDDGIVMGLRHKSLPIEGIQFHPESILTVEGPKIISNWVASCINAVADSVSTE
jgi:anthranilate synthase/aminodeoxychorismate synthase-like glutamine amidotransferase